MATTAAGRRCGGHLTLADFSVGAWLNYAQQAVSTEAGTLATRMNAARTCRYYDALKTRRFVIYPGKVSTADCFRIGTIGHVFPEDIALLVEQVAEVLAEMGVRLTAAACPAPNSRPLRPAAGFFEGLAGFEQTL
jgi:aspartate aminotransferase-like enzyme